MADIVNLNRARKKNKAIAEKREADSNRVKFGQTKAAKARLKSERERAERALSGAKVEDPSECE